MDGDLVLRRQRFLRRLVSELTCDEHAAEDLAQATWLRALERPPREGIMPRAWLARVARNLAINRGRARRAQGSLEAQAEERSWPSAAEVAARLELAERVLAAVRALPEPLGAVVLARYYEELRLEEIARRSGLPLDTVKDRLKRARELLRSRLGRELGEERGLAAWLGWLSGLMDWIGGGVLVKKSLALAAVLLVGLWWSQARRNPDLVQPVPEGPAPQTLVDSPRAPLVAAERTEVPTAIVAAPDAGALLLRVRWPDGTPAEHVTARIWPDEERELARFFRMATTGMDGRASIEGLAPGLQRVQLERERDFTRVEVRAGEAAALELSVSPGPRIEGLVVDEHEQPVPGARVWLARRVPTHIGGAPLDDAPAALSASDGRFTIPSAGAAHAIGACAEGFAPSVHKSIGTSGDALEQVRLVLPDLGGSIAGRVTGPDGAALAGALVSGDVGRKFTETRLGPDIVGEHVLDSLRMATFADAEGGFRFTGVQPGEVELTVFAPELQRWRGIVRVEAGATAWVEAALEMGSGVAGRIATESGAPIAGALVFASLRARDGAVEEDAPWLAQEWSRLVSSRGDDYVVARSGADGSYRLSGLPAGWTYVAAEAGDSGCELASLRIDSASEARLDLVLTRGLELCVRLVDTRGVPLAGLSVFVARQMGDGGATSGARGPYRTDESGRFAVPNCQDAPYSIDIRHGRYGRRVLCPEASRGKRPGAEEHTLVLDYADPEPAFVRGFVLDESGAPIAGAVVGCTPERQGFYGGTTRSDASGIFRSAELEPGSYRIAVGAETHARTRLGTVTLGPGETLDPGAVTLKTAGFLVLRLRRADGGPVDDRLDLYLDSASEHRAGGTLGNIELGHARFSPLEPGAYVLHALGEGLRDPRLPVRIEVGTNELELVLERGGWRILRFVGPRGPIHPAFLRVVVRAGSGEVVLEETLEEDGAVGFLTGHAFEPGAYTLEARCDDGRCASGAFEVPDGASEAEPLEFELR